MRCWYDSLGASGCGRWNVVVIQAVSIMLFAAPLSRLLAESRTYSLTCAVTDSAGHALPEIPVELQAVNPPHEQIRSHTGPDGSFIFRALHEGLYEITVAGGIVLAPKRVTVGGGQPSRIALKLPIAPANALGNSGNLVSVQQLALPQRIQRMMRDALAAWLRNDVAQSRKLCERILFDRPDFGSALALLGILDLQQGYPAKAIPVLWQALRQNPECPQAYLALASAYDQLRQNDEALDALALLSKVAPESWQLHYETGRAYLGQKRYQLALAEFSRALVLDKQQDAVVNVGKSHALLGLRNYLEARAALVAVIAAAPNGPDTAEARQLLAAVDAQAKGAQSAIVTSASSPDPPNEH